jgi:hypothetical protein
MTDPIKNTLSMGITSQMKSKLDATSLNQSKYARVSLVQNMCLDGMFGREAQIAAGQVILEKLIGSGIIGNQFQQTNGQTK